MKNTKFSFMLVLLVLFSIPSHAKEEKPSWVEDKAHLEELISENKCTEYWDVLWPWAKKGNLEARAWLFILMAPPPKITPIFAPGNSGDLITKIRNIVIMAAHSHDYQGDLSLWPGYKNTTNELYKMVGFNKSVKGKQFLECTKDNKAKDCTEIAVKSKLVPSFEKYAEQMDMFIEDGMRSKCAYRNRKRN